MSKDIRSYFQLKKPGQKPKPQEDDDDVIPESPDVQIKNKKKETKKRRVLDDSDEEIFSTKKKTNSNEAQASNASKKTAKPPLKEVKLVDLFGNGPIKRTETLVKKKKVTETGIHSDEEFEKSLLEIDDIDTEPNNSKVSSNKEKNANKDEKSPSKVEKSNSAKELLSPSKLSTKEETKDKKEKLNNHSKSKDSKKDDQKSKSEKNDKKSNHTASHESNSDKKSKIDNSKRKFSEFLDDDHHSGSSKKKKPNDNHEDSKHKSPKKDNHNESKGTVKNKHEHDSSISESMHVDDSQTNKKKKLNKSLNESVLTDEERHERRIASATLYKSYLNRSGPKHLGAKEMPEGTPDCLKDCAFLLTGVMDSFEKDEIAAVITKYGGCVKSGVSKKVTHVIAGEDAGPAKMAKAQELGIKILNEDEFLKMIVDRSNKKADKPEIKKEIKKEKSPHKSHHKGDNRDKSPHKCDSRDKSKNISNSKEKDKKDNHVDGKSKKSPNDKIKTEPHSSKDSSSKSKLDTKEHKHKDKSKSPKHIKEEIKTEPKSEKKGQIKESTSSTVSEVNGSAKPEIERPANASMWVEKYKPQNIKQIIGQHGDASNVKKLINWLTKWYVNRKAKLPKPSPWAKNDDGGYYKAALLSGPPGVGKTTTVSLVCKELGFDMVEFNASDTRNKTLIKEQIGELLTTTSLSGFAKGETGKQAITKKHVLVMDEVDGMAGNEDRGGLQELITLIKSASVPIICMCNDRNSQKMRSLVNYCYDLRFNRPRIDQIKFIMQVNDVEIASSHVEIECGYAYRTNYSIFSPVTGVFESNGPSLNELVYREMGTSVAEQLLMILLHCGIHVLLADLVNFIQFKISAMMSICFKEGIKIPPDVISQLITSANQDVRQTLNLLSMWAIDPTRTDADRLRKDAQVSKKDVKLGPWDAIRKVFSAEEHKTMSINDRSDLFFYDYSLAPLFVQENYLQVAPHCDKREVLQRLSKAADSISMGDLVDARIRGNQAWSLLPLQAMYASVIPGHELSGHMTGQIQFPGWLGKNSRGTKMRRLCQEIHAHTRLSTSGSKSSIFLDYAPHIRDAIINPLIKDRTDGIPQSLEVLESYHLLREDLDSLVELSLWPGQRNPTILIDTKVKAAMTRTYNKKASALPYAPGAVKRARPRDDDDENGDEEQDDDEQPDSDPENDALIKKKKSKDADKPGPSKEKKNPKPAARKTKEKEK